MQAETRGDLGRPDGPANQKMLIRSRRSEYPHRAAGERGLLWLIVRLGQ